MERQKKRISPWLKMLLVVTFITFLVQGCNPDPITNELIDVAIKTRNADYSIPELTKADSILIDSISNLPEFKEFARNFQQMAKKARPVMKSLSKEELEGLDRQESASYSAVMSKIRTEVDINEELQAIDKNSKFFHNLIKNAQLSKSVRAALAVRAVSDSIKWHR